jgi:hypothetical protein
LACRDTVRERIVSSSVSVVHPEPAMADHRACLEFENESIVTKGRAYTCRGHSTRRWRSGGLLSTQFCSRIHLTSRRATAGARARV